MASESDGTGDDCEGLLREAHGLLAALGADVEGWKLEALLLKGPYDLGDCRVTVTAGAGGTDAQDWAEMVLRMYERWAERKGFRCKCIGKRSEGEEAGVRQGGLEICGEHAYGLLAGEKGTHRLVRISPFNSQGKRQTSFCGVEVVPLLSEEALAEMEDLDLPESDLEISFMRSGGAGGQVRHTCYME